MFMYYKYEDEKYYNDNEDDILPTIPPLPTALAAYKVIFM